MSSLATAHGWPDGEARPMPYGKVLYQDQRTSTGAITIGQLETGAWPALAVSIQCQTGPCRVQLTWHWIGAELVTSPVCDFWHPGDGSTMLIQNRGHYLKGGEITTPAGAAVSTVLAGSNRVADDQPIAGAFHTISVGDGSPGDTIVPLYTVQPGQKTILHSINYLFTNGALFYHLPTFVEYLEPGGNQLTFVLINGGGQANEVLRITATTQQGGAATAAQVEGYTEDTWNSFPRLPAWRLPAGYQVQLNLNNPNNDSQVTEIFLLLEDF